MRRVVACVALLLATAGSVQAKALLMAGRHTTAQFVKEVQQEVDVEIAGFPLRTCPYRNDCTLPARAHIEKIKRDRLF